MNTGILSAPFGIFCLPICFWLGKPYERPWFRLARYPASIALGIASIYPALILLSLEESLIGLKETGNLVQDLIYFVVGVGLREELAKLACFALLLPILRKRGQPIDVIMCGALVGLGFAVEENLAYFSEGNLAAAVTRFLTANVLHMSMTGILAHALDDFMRRPDEGAAADFSRSLAMVVILHGAYDFFLSNPEVKDLSFLAMSVFVILLRDFFRAVRDARGRGKERAAWATFVLGTVVLCGSSFVYASILLGPALAATVLAEGLLGVAVFIYVFARELGSVPA